MVNPGSIPGTPQNPRHKFNLKIMLNKIKARVKAEMKHGDIANACKIVGVTRTVYDTAIHKTTMDALTAKEEKVLFALLDIFNDRKAKQQKL